MSVSVLCLLAFCLLLPAACCFAEDLTAADILRAVRAGQSSRHESLNGQLRNDSDGKVFPFKLTADGPQVRYDFPGKLPTTMQVRYNDDNSQLEESTGGGPAEKLTPANYDKPILGTALTYEDLALRFVYWTRARIEEPDDSTTFPAYKLRLDAPGSGRSQYTYVLVWVGKESGALLRAEGYNAEGKIIRRFTVTSGQKIEGRWYLKQMRIEKLNPTTGRGDGRTYLEIRGPSM